MTTGKVIWPPYPFQAGFCITDDTDAATFEQVKAVYDFLSSRQFLTSKTVWPFDPSDKCGIPPTPDSTLRGVTLQDGEYLEYCKMLHSKGYEICLHGASAGNNLRISTINAFEFLRKEIGHSDTYICHSKNAENIYWNDRITSLFPFNYLLKHLSKYECSGEILESPYFWGDICQNSINQIRLYRTRCINTLKRNPSMPYYCPSRPFVKGWFSATKRSLSDCAHKKEQEKLIKENGLTVLYQYLHRYSSPDGHNLNNRFVDAVESLLSNNTIKIDTVSNSMARLRLIQGIFIFFEGNSIWIINTNLLPVNSLQIVFDKFSQFSSDQCKIEFADNIANIKGIPANSIVRLESDRAIRIQGKRCFPTHCKRTISKEFSYGKLHVNLSGSCWNISNKLHIEPYSFYLEAAQSRIGSNSLSHLPLLEETSLLVGQLWIVAREILFKGRSLNNAKYLDDSKTISLEDHENW